MKNSESSASLRVRKRKIHQTLPPFDAVLRGSLFQREIRCGKPTCHCAKGPGHPVRYVSVSFPKGRTEQVTVPADLAPTIQSWIQNYLLWWQAIEAVSAINLRLLRLRDVASPSPSRDIKGATGSGRPASPRGRRPGR
jgi:hypothetical protein